MLPRQFTIEDLKRPLSVMELSENRIPSDYVSHESYFKDFHNMIAINYDSHESQLANISGCRTVIEDIQLMQINIEAYVKEKKIYGDLKFDLFRLANMVNMVKRYYPEKLKGKKLEANQVYDSEKVNEFLFGSSEEERKEMFEIIIILYQRLIQELHHRYDEAANNGMNWYEYVAVTDRDKIHEAIEKAYQKMTNIYDNAIVLETAKFQHIAAKYKDKGGDAIIKQLLAFRKLINELETKNIDANIIDSFREIVMQIETELLQDDVCDLAMTTHPTILTEFTEVANRLLSNKPLEVAELKDLGNRLNQIPISYKLQISAKTKAPEDVASDVKKAPMSPAMKSKIYLAIGMLVGAAIGFAIGAAVTFWGCGFGGIVGAIAGATFVQGLMLGGAALGGAVVTGIPAAIIGHRHATKNHTLFNKKYAPKLVIKTNGPEASKATSAKLNEIKDKAIESLQANPRWTH